MISRCLRLSKELSRFFFLISSLASTRLISLVCIRKIRNRAISTRVDCARSLVRAGYWCQYCPHCNFFVYVRNLIIFGSFASEDVWDSCAVRSCAVEYLINHYESFVRDHFYVRNIKSRTIAIGCYLRCFTYSFLY